MNVQEAYDEAVAANEEVVWAENALERAQAKARQAHARWLRAKAEDYTVLDVRRVGEHVDALVQYEADSGTAWRTWDAGKEVPLKRRPE